MPYYKATRPSGHDFYSGTVDYAGALASGEVITHPLKTTRLRDDALYYLSVATRPRRVSRADVLSFIGITVACFVPMMVAVWWRWA